MEGYDRMIRREIGITTLLGLLSVLLVSCSGDTGAPRDPLAGTEWQVERIEDAGRIAGTDLTLEFSQGQVRGNSGCNSFGGTYQVDGNELRFEQLAQTLMACTEPQGNMEQEQAYMRALNSTERFEIRNGSLVLFDAAGQRVLLSRAD